MLIHLLLVGYVLVDSGVATDNINNPATGPTTDNNDNAYDKLSATLLEIKLEQKSQAQQMATLYQHMSALLAATNSQINGINSQLNGLNNQFNAQVKHHDVNEKTFSRQMTDMDAKISTVQTELSNTKAVMSNVRAELSGMKTGVKHTNDGVTKIMQDMLTSSVFTGALKNQQQSLDSHTSTLNKLSQCSCPRDQVFYVRDPVARYQFTLDDAKTACKAKGGDLAAPQHLEEAWKMGYENCACGWLNDGSIRYPMHFGKNGCGGYAPGIKTCYTTGAHPHTLADAYCVSYHWTLA